VSRAVYVGKLYAIQLEGQEPVSCAEVILGVDEELGLVQAESRQELAAGEYMDPPPRARGKKCIRLWYERSRKEYPRDRFWFHDLDDARAYFVAGLDKNRQIPDRTIKVAPVVIIRGPDVETCPDPPGDFLCG
jgi:hypothetical protein